MRGRNSIPKEATTPSTGIQGSRNVSVKGKRQDIPGEDSGDNGCPVITSVYRTEKTTILNAGVERTGNEGIDGKRHGSASSSQTSIRCCPCVAVVCGTGDAMSVGGGVHGAGRERVNNQGIDVLDVIGMWIRNGVHQRPRRTSINRAVDTARICARIQRGRGFGIDGQRSDGP